MEEVKHMLLIIFVAFNVSSYPVFDKQQESDSYPVKEIQPASDENVEIKISGELSQVSNPIPILENEDFEDLPEISVFENQLDEEDEEDFDDGQGVNDIVSPVFDDVQEANDIVSPVFELQNDDIEKGNNAKSDDLGKVEKDSPLVEVNSPLTSDDTIAAPYDFFPSNC